MIVDTTDELRMTMLRTLIKAEKWLHLNEAERIVLIIAPVVEEYIQTADAEKERKRALCAIQQCDAAAAHSSLEDRFEAMRIRAELAEDKLATFRMRIPRQA